MLSLEERWILRWSANKKQISTLNIIHSVHPPGNVRTDITILNKRNRSGPQLERILKNLFKSPHRVILLRSDKLKDLQIKCTFRSPHFLVPDTIQLPDSTIRSADFFHFNKHIQRVLTSLVVLDLVEELVSDD